ncbi:MAG: hypothetical protein V7632_1252 [Bradyrhizobium sp.]|jgi:hypothetical protein
MIDAKDQNELTRLAEDALRAQPGCETARVPVVVALPDVRIGRNWEIPNVVLGDSLISDVDRGILSVHRRLGRKFRLKERQA